LDPSQYLERDKELVFRNCLMDTLSSEDAVVIIALGTGGMLVLIGGIASFILLYQKKVLSEQKKRAEREMEYQNEMIKMQLESQEAERARIGADLHDSMSSLLWGAKVHAAFIDESSDLKGEAKIAYNELYQILDQSLDTVRRISWELTPEAFVHSGLSQSVEKLCGRLNGKGIEVNFRETNGRDWHDNDALQAYRIVQELLSNAIKHAQAKTVLVSLAWKENELEIKVQDDGIGFDLGTERKGVGWWNIEQRAKRLGAKISIGDTTMPSGAAISVIIPLNHEKRKN
jgi:signal transduction histidine kinase